MDFFVDDADRQLLQPLQENSKMSYADLFRGPKDTTMRKRDEFSLLDPTNGKI